MARTSKTRRILAAGPLIGAAFSSISSISLGDGLSKPLEVLVSFAYGAVEGLLIVGTCFMIGFLFPRLYIRRNTRIGLVFLGAAALHIVGALLFSSIARGLGLGSPGRNFIILAGMVGLVAVLAGEAVHNIEEAEKAALAEEKAEAEARAARAETETAVALATASFRLNDSFVARFGLTAREREIADLLLAKLSYAEIAERLFISMPTVKSHSSSIYAKTGTERRREFCDLAARESQVLP